MIIARNRIVWYFKKYINWTKINIHVKNVLIKTKNLITSALLMMGFVLCFTNCNDNSKAIEDQFALTAPNGEVMASSINEVTQWARNSAMDKFGYQGSEVKILNISYYQGLLDGYVATILFSAGEHTGKFLISSVPFNTETGGRTEEGCIKWQITCSGESCCTPTFDVNTGQSSCTCSSGNNSGCTLTAECLQQE